MENIILKAKAASLKAYTPYSKFKVGCVLEFSSKKLVLGANVENASYGATICAEQNAIGTMFSLGIKPKTIKQIAVYNKEAKLCFPCGICRQIMSEIFPNKTKLIVGNDSFSKTITVDELLPFAFGKENLDV